MSKKIISQEIKEQIYQLKKIRLKMKLMKGIGEKGASTFDSRMDRKIIQEINQLSQGRPLKHDLSYYKTQSILQDTIFDNKDLVNKDLLGGENIENE